VIGLFIAFLCMITLFVTPVGVGMNAYTLDIGEKIRVTLAVPFYAKYLELGGKKSEKNDDEDKADENKRKKKKNFKIKIDFKTALRNIDKVIIDHIKLDLTLPQSMPPMPKYMTACAIMTTQQALERANYGFNTGASHLHLAEADDGKLYFQAKLKIKLNLFIIFSIVFQIIKIRIHK